MLRPATLFALVLSVTSAASPLQAQGTGIEFDPPAPVTWDAVTIRATYLSTCAVGLGRAVVAGSVIRMTVFEGCRCLPQTPHRVEAVTTVGPLPAGTYQIELVSEPEPADPGCELPPEHLASGELTVMGEGLVVRLAPRAPTTADDVVVTVLSPCPIAFEQPSRDGNLIRVTEIPSPILAPCSNEPAWSSELALGTLPAGDYTLLFFYDDGPSLPRATQVHGFRVEPVSATELLLQAGRFRVTALWERRNAAGPARALPLTPDAGVFWFSKPKDLEALVRVLDGCGSTGHYWFFAGGATHAGIEIRVEDTFTGAVRVYSSPLGEAFGPVFDTRAFPCLQ